MDADNICGNDKNKQKCHGPNLKTAILLLISCFVMAY